MNQLVLSLFSYISKIFKGRVLFKREKFSEEKFFDGENTTGDPIL